VVDILQMNTSVLEKTSSNEGRPYSRKELELLHKNLLRKMRIGSVYVSHPECGHGYYCKAGGRKEKDVTESKGQNIGNCSVCWKFNRTPKRLKNAAKDLINYYSNRSPESYNSPSVYFSIELETDFYTWLYNEFNPTEKKDT
jgi:hypothetical protein